MRYAILSDVHSNLSALEAVLNRIERESVDRFLCLGDTVGYGPSPNECCALVRSLDPIIVRGNHDLAAVTPGAEEWFTPAARQCILWTREQLAEDNWAFLAALQPAAEADCAHICHGSVFDPDYYTSTPQDATLSFQVMSLPLGLFGHTHYAEWFTDSEDSRIPVQHPMPHGGILQVEPGKRYLLNPGAVGQPRDGNSQAAYAIWDTVAGTLTLARVPYNIRATQEKMETAGLPWTMSSRLTMGV